MLTEVDTRDIGGQTVSLYMDTKAQVYLVCLEGHEPITCLSRDKASQAYLHPFAYIPLEGHRSASKTTLGATEGISLVDTPASPEELTRATENVLVELKQLLDAMETEGFRSTVGMLSDIVKASGKRKGRR